jgi:signal transduction protein with GAF and PtsI domain
MTPHNSLRIKRLLSRFTMEEARQVAQHALTLQTSSEVSDYVITYVRTHYPEEFWVPDWCEDGPCLTRDPEREPMI